MEKSHDCYEEAEKVTRKCNPYSLLSLYTWDRLEEQRFNELILKLEEEDKQVQISIGHTRKKYDIPITHDRQSWNGTRPSS